MKKFLASCFVAGALLACGSNDSTQNVRDNETPVMAGDEVDNFETTPDTLVIDTTAIK